MSVIPATQPTSVTTNPDGDIWVLGRTAGTEDDAALRVTTSGTTVADYPLDSIEGSPTVIVTGSDGMIWFGAQGSIARLDPSIPPNS